MNDKYPCVFGILALSGQVPLLYTFENKNTLFVDTQRRIIVYQRGGSIDIHIHNNEGRMLIVLGRIYNPVYLAPSVQNKVSVMKSLINLVPKIIEGNYLSIYFSRDNKGNLDFRLSTDKYGSKTILYYQDNRLLYFSTHLAGMKCLLKNKLPNISRNSLLHYYHFGVTANDKTLLKAINKVPPASSLNIDGSNIVIRKYFRLVELYDPNRYLRLSEDDICNEINTLMTKSILKRNPGKKPISLAISSGVDSGFIAKKLVENGIEVIGYNLAYGEYYDEYNRLSMFAKDIGININKHKITAKELINSVEFANSISSEPIGFNDCAMRLLTLKAQKNGIDTLWDGDGADRLFLGMNRQLKYQRVVYIYNILKKAGLILPVTMLLRLFKNNEFKKLYIIFRNWQNKIPPYPERIYGKIQRYNEEYEQNVYNLGIRHYWESFLREFKTKDFKLYFTYQSINMCPEMFFHPPSEQQLYFGLFPGSPYWDDEIVSLALSIPMNLKTKRGKTKYILRKAAALNNNQNYWMLPKIGLQNAFNFAINSQEGKEWRNKQHEKILAAQEYNIVREHIGKEKVDLDKLIILNLWKEKNNIICT